MTDIDKAKKYMEEKDSESEAFAALQKEVKQLRKDRRTDTFYFIFFQIIIIDAILFMFVVDGGAALALALLQIVFILLIADKFDITYVEVILARVSNVFGKNNGNGDS